MRIGFKEYKYDHSKHKVFYLTINDVQFGGPLFSMDEVTRRILELK